MGPVRPLRAISLSHSVQVHSPFNFLSTTRHHYLSCVQKSPECFVPSRHARACGPHEFREHSVPPQQSSSFLLSLPQCLLQFQTLCSILCRSPKWTIMLASSVSPARVLIHFRPWGLTEAFLAPLISSSSRARSRIQQQDEHSPCFRHIGISRPFATCSMYDSVKLNTLCIPHR